MFLFFIYIVRGPYVPDLWLPVKCPHPTLFPQELREVLKSLSRAGTKEIRELSCPRIGDFCRIGGRRGGWDGRVHSSLDWPVPVELAHTLWLVDPWDPPLGLWIPGGRGGRGGCCCCVAAVVVCHCCCWTLLLLL